MTIKPAIKIWWDKNTKHECDMDGGPWIGLRAVDNMNYTKYQLLFAVSFFFSVQLINDQLKVSSSGNT